MKIVHLEVLEPYDPDDPSESTAQLLDAVGAKLIAGSEGATRSIWQCVEADEGSVRRRLAATNVEWEHYVTVDRVLNP